MPEDITLVRSAPVSPEGRWFEYSTREKYSEGAVFSPSSVVAAKKYIRKGCPPRPPVSPGATPLTSRALPQSKLCRRSAAEASNSSKMVCHGCHGVMGSGQHNGSVPGKDRCTLPHSSSCPGGVLEDDSWRACPTGYVPGVPMSMTGFEDTLQYSDFLPRNNPEINSTPVVSPLIHQLSQIRISAPTESARGASNEEDLARLHRQANGEGARSRVIQERFPSIMLADTSPGQANSMQSNILPADLSQDVMHLRALNQGTQQKDRNTDDITIAEIRGMPGLKEQVDVHISNLRDRIPALAPAPSVPPPGQAAQHQPPDSHLVQNMEADIAEVERLQAEASAELQSLRQAEEARRQHTQVIQQQRELAVKQAQQQAAALEEQRRMKLRRATEELRATQNALMELRQRQNGSVPSIISDGRDPRRAQTAGVEDSVPQSYEYFVDKDGRTCRILRTVAVHPPLSPPTPALKWVDRWSPLTGRRYQVQVAVPPGQVSVGTGRGTSSRSLPGFASPYPMTTHWEDRWSPLSGRRYQVQVPDFPTSSNVGDTGSIQQAVRFHPFTGQPYNGQMHPGQPQMSPEQSTTQQLPTPRPSCGTDRHTSLTSHQQRGESGDDQVTRNQGQAGDRVKGIFKLSGQGDSLKKLSLLDYIKRCPTKWSKEVTCDNMNLPVFAYGVTSELVACLSGRAEPLSQSVLLGKLQHMQSVLEICCQNSTLQEFTNYGWVLARDYACKVQNKVDQQLLEWDQLSAGVQTAVLVSAQCEYPRPPKKSKEDDKKVPLCTTYNTCTTEKKCQYEVANPSKVCQRKHECSYCRKTLNKGVRHQAWKCPNKIEN